MILWLRKLPHCTHECGTSSRSSLARRERRERRSSRAAPPGRSPAPGSPRRCPCTPARGHGPRSLANLAGTLILGWVVVAKERWRPLVGTGFCGALTTFSTFQVQLVELGDDGHVPLAAAYLAVSVAVGLAGRGGRSEDWRGDDRLGRDDAGRLARRLPALARRAALLAPRGTLAVNLTGAFAAGVLDRRRASARPRC